MASRRRRKQKAQSLGLTQAELQLCELLEEVLAAMRWTQVLGWGNQFLLNERLQVTAEERDRVMRAAATAVERDSRIQDWQQRLAEIKDKLAAMDRALRPDGPPPQRTDGPAPQPPDGSASQRPPPSAPRDGAEGAGDR